MKVLAGRPRAYVLHNSEEIRRCTFLLQVGRLAPQRQGACHVAVAPFELHFEWVHLQLFRNSLFQSNRFCDR